jgi:hypothetical protein
MTDDKDREKMIAEFIENNKGNEEKYSEHGGYDQYIRNKKIIDNGTLPKYIGGKWGYKTSKKR